MTYFNQTNSAWTPEKVAVVQQYWGNGKNAREIGDMIDMSRGAVIGKAGRLGLSGDPPPTTRKAREERREARDHKRSHLRCAETRYHSHKRVRVSASAGISSGFQASLAHTCQWLEGEPRDRDFCGAPSREGSSYCEAHRRRCVIGYWTPGKAA